MEITATSRNKIGIQPIKAYEIRQGLVGLNVDGSSDHLLKYVGYFASLVNMRKAYFLHVQPDLNIFNLYPDSGEFLNGETEIDLDLIDKIKVQVGQVISEDSKIKTETHVRSGDPLEELLETADLIKADFVIVGHNVDRHHHGILMKNFARQVWSNALIIPNKAKPAIKKMMVPVDFSINSAEALRTAVAINKRLPKPTKIAVVHVCHLPANFSAHRFNLAKVEAMLEEDRERELHRFIALHVPEEDKNMVEPILLKHGHHGIGYNLVKFAESKKYDLVVMGAKGHTKVALLLMGSVTEKVLSLSSRFPVLVVK